MRAAPLLLTLSGLGCATADKTVDDSAATNPDEPGTTTTDTGGGHATTGNTTGNTNSYGTTGGTTRGTYHTYYTTPSYDSEPATGQGSGT